MREEIKRQVKGEKEFERDKWSGWMESGRGEREREREYQKYI